MTLPHTLLVACCIGIIIIAQTMRQIRIRRTRQFRGDP